MARRLIVAVVGDAGCDVDSVTYKNARQLGKLIVDNGFRVQCGGLDGVMAGVCQGAHESSQYREGDTIGIIPQIDPKSANPWVDIVIGTGMQHTRNAIVANADAVVAIGGGAGTLSEICFAWAYHRLVIAFNIEGWSGKVAGIQLDKRIRYEHIKDDRIFEVNSGEEALEIINTRVHQYTQRGKLLCLSGDDEDFYASGSI